MAKNRGIHGAMDDAPLDALLTLSQRERLDAARCAHQENNIGNLSDAYILDVSQSVDWLRGAPWWPAVQRLTRLLSLQKQHVLTPLEVDLAMGWPVLPHVGSQEYMGLIPRSYFEMTTQDAHALAGNGMMLQQVA
eukprot:4332226-Lingulodinium_polyedra.AAC.1